VALVEALGTSASEPELRAVADLGELLAGSEHTYGLGFRRSTKLGALVLSFGQREDVVRGIVAWRANYHLYALDPIPLLSR
jgi:hypothetical protein